MSDAKYAVAVREAPLFAIESISDAIEFSAQMAKADLLPPHLKGKPADCLRVVMQAARWNMDPFSVADKTSIIGGKLNYEGQLVSAVVNSRGNLAKKLNYTFEGEGDKRVLTVSGTIKGEDEPRTITLDVPLARKINKNGQININPDQQMCYIGARLWARRHTSELMLGVYTPDEIDPDEPTNVTGTADVPDRPEAPAKATTGAAAAVAEGAVHKKTRGPGKKNEAAKIVEGEFAMGDKAPVTPAKVFTTLADGQTETLLCTIERYTTAIIESGGQKQPSVRVALKGGFEGDVIHLGGATQTFDADDKPILTPLPAYQVEKPVLIGLIGRARKPSVDPVTKVETARPPAILVTKIELAPEQAAPPAPAAESPAPATSEVD